MTPDGRRITPRVGPLPRLGERPGARTAAKLADDDLRRPATLDRSSAFDTIRHLVDVNWSWRQLCIGNHVGETYVWEHGFPLDDVTALRTFSWEEDARLRAYVKSLEQGALDEPLGMSEDTGDGIPRWLILAHVVNHGTTHRSELARFLTEHGHSPGDLDLLDALTLPWPEAP